MVGSFWSGNYLVIKLKCPQLRYVTVYELPCFLCRPGSVSDRTEKEREIVSMDDIKSFFNKKLKQTF